MATYLARYLAGEHEQVWHELVRLGEAARDESTFSDAQAVAREMMRRVRHNIMLLIPRLRDRGYRFALQEPLTPPVDQVESYLAVMEEWGPLPLALRAFYEIVGAVSLDGTFPDDHPWYEKAAFPASPLTVADLLPNFDRWMEAREDEEQSVDLDVCYDPAGVLGAFTLPCPCRSVDEPLEMEGGYTLPGPYGGQMLFVEYLRISLRWGGFPSLAYPQVSDIPEGEVAPLVDGFLAF